MQINYLWHNNFTTNNKQQTMINWMLDDVTELLMDFTELEQEKEIWPEDLEEINLQQEVLRKHIQYLLNIN